VERKDISRWKERRQKEKDDDISRWKETQVERNSSLSSHLEMSDPKLPSALMVLSRALKGKTKYFKPHFPTVFKVSVLLRRTRGGKVCQVHV
jgi:hypothetical protein